MAYVSRSFSADFLLTLFRLNWSNSTAGKTDGQIVSWMLVRLSSNGSGSVSPLVFSEDPALIDDLTLVRVNNIYFAILWASVPILISVISLTTFVMTGHELTVPTAFTVCHSIL